MSATAAEKTGHANFYSQAKNNPEVLEQRRRRAEEQDRQVAAILQRNPGRVPDWEPERVMQMDRFCLAHGKRCIMWDDEGAGFFLLMNWDWVANRPAALKACPERKSEPGWWDNIRAIMAPPLLDPALGEGEVAAWVDARTMAVHHRLLEAAGSLRRCAGGGFTLDPHPYWAELQALPPLPPQPDFIAAARAAA